MTDLKAREATMSVWRFETREKVVRAGDYERKMLTPDGCNEPFKNRFWCPKRGWFLREPCPFVNKQECDTYKRMCGSL